MPSPKLPDELLHSILSHIVPVKPAYVPSSTRCARTSAPSVTSTRKHWAASSDSVSSAKTGCASASARPSNRHRSGSTGAATIALSSQKSACTVSQSTSTSMSAQVRTLLRLRRCQLKYSRSHEGARYAQTVGSEEPGSCLTGYLCRAHTSQVAPRAQEREPNVAGHAVSTHLVANLAGNGRSVLQLGSRSLHPSSPDTSPGNACMVLNSERKLWLTVDLLPRPTARSRLTTPGARVLRANTSDLLLSDRSRSRRI